MAVLGEVLSFEPFNGEVGIKVGRALHPIKSGGWQSWERYCHLNLLMVKLSLRWVGHYIILKVEDGSPGRGIVI